MIVPSGTASQDDRLLNCAMVDRASPAAAAISWFVSGARPFLVRASSRQILGGVRLKISSNSELVVEPFTELAAPSAFP